MAIDINVPSQVKTYANLAAFPATGSLKTIFIAEDTNKTYRWTGSVYVEVSAAGASGITIGTTAITSGTVGRVLFEGTGNVVQESANLFWDNTNGRLGIGTSSPLAKVSIIGTDSLVSGSHLTIQGTGTAGLAIADYYSSNTYIAIYPTSVALASRSFTNLFFYGSSSGNESMFNSTATTRIGVNGATQIGVLSSGAYIPNSLSIGQSNVDASRLFVKGSGATTTTSSFLVFNSASTELFRIRDNGAVLINTTTDAGFKLDVNGTARIVNTLYVNTGNVSGQGIQMASDSNMGIFNNSGRMQLRQYSSAFELASNGSNVFLSTDGARINTIANYGMALGTLGVTSASASAILEAFSTTKGFLPPRMTTTQKNAIATPATGLMVYDTTLNLISVYNGTTWITL